MKILSTPIEVLAWFENGTPHPIRFKLADKEIARLEVAIGGSMDWLTRHN